MKLRTFIISLFISLITLPAFGQQSDEKIKPLYEKFQRWHFRVNPYLWYLGVKGQILTPPAPSQLPEPPPSYDIDLSFKEIRNSIKFFLMLSTEYRGKHFIATASVTSLILQGTAITPLEVVSQGVDYRLSYLTSEITAGYRALKMEKLNLDVMLGVRMLYTRIEAASNIFNYEIAAERSVFWYDPILATRLKYIPYPKAELTFYADFGPIRNVDSYQIAALGTYLFTKLFNMSLGYRYYFVNSEAEQKETIFKGRVFGPYVKFGFQF